MKRIDWCIRLILDKKVNSKEFMLVVLSIVSITTVSFTLMSTDEMIEVPMGPYSAYLIPQRFLYAIYGLTLGAIIVIVMAFTLIIIRKL